MTLSVAIIPAGMTFFVRDEGGDEAAGEGDAEPHREDRARERRRRAHQVAGDDEEHAREATGDERRALLFALTKPITPPAMERRPKTKK